jgi:hypothetical protein
MMLDHGHEFVQIFTRELALNKFGEFVDAHVAAYFFRAGVNNGLNYFF